MNLIYKAVDDDYCLFLDNVKNGTSLSTYSRSLKGATDTFSVSEGRVNRHKTYCAPQPQEQWPRRGWGQVS